MEMLSSVLEHGIDVLEQCAASLPRKTRRSVREVIDRAEAFVDSIDTAWCDGLSRCDGDALSGLGELLCTVQGFDAGSCDASAASSNVTELLDCLERCGSVAVQCLSALDTGADESARMGVLECVRELSTDHLESESESEASLFHALKDHLCSSES